MPAEPSTSRLVFVGGLHRSGTTALARALAAHPHVSGFSGTGAKEDEGQHLQDVYPPARAFGGAGRFASDAAAHLTEDSPLATTASATRLLEQWGQHWDLSRPVLVEKSPPNLVRTRFLQALFPSSRFVVVVRHPAVVALSTARWRRWAAVESLLRNWIDGHRTFYSDAAHLQHVHVLRYERLVASPASVLEDVASFVGLDGPIPSDALQRGRSDVYEQQWQRLLSRRGPSAWKLRRAVNLLEPLVHELGYSLKDLSQRPPLPPVGAPPAHEGPR